MVGKKSSKRKDSIHGNATVGNAEKTIQEKFNIPGFKIINKDGRDTRSDKLMKNHRNDWGSD